MPGTIKWRKAHDLEDEITNVVSRHIVKVPSKYFCLNLYIFVREVTFSVAVINVE